MINPDWRMNIPFHAWVSPAKIKRYEQTVQMAQDIIDYRWTIRQCAKNYCIGKSSVSRWIELYLKDLDVDLYHEVKTQLNLHRRYTRSWRSYV